MQMPSSVVLRRTADLVPYANNARTHTPEQVKQIAASEQRAARAARGRGPLRAGRGRNRDRNVGLAANPGLPHVPARPHRMALLSIGICWAVATINAQLSPGQNRQSSPLITPAYHGSTSAIITGSNRPEEDTNQSVRRIAVTLYRDLLGGSYDRYEPACRTTFFFRTRKNYRREIRKAAETLSFRAADREPSPETPLSRRNQRVPSNPNGGPALP
jgi:hypothetical protein